MLAGGREHSVFHTLDLKSALALAVALERAKAGLLMLHDGLSGHLYPALGQGMTAGQCADFGIHRSGLGLFGIAFAERRPVTAQCSPDMDPDLRRCMQALRCIGLSAVPLPSDAASVLGLLVLLHPRPRPEPAGPLLLLYASVLATALDNVHRREVAERARERAEIRSQAKTQFFTRISHELRTPLQSVIGYVDLMRLERTEPVSRRHQELLARIGRSSEAMLSVIDDLINFSRVEVGRVRYDLRRVSVNDAMAAAEIVVAPLATIKGVALQIEPSPPAFVRADPAKLKQILVNLLANSVRFTPGGGAVRMNVRKAAGRAAQWVTVSVVDTGRGIPSDKLHQIFEPFANLGIPPLDGMSGSGLGLPISREFATAMGGDLAASSDGHGSTFTLRLLRDRLTRRRPANEARASTTAP
jgi:signal transduction histidine kinase